MTMLLYASIELEAICQLVLVELMKILIMPWHESKLHAHLHSESDLIAASP